MTIEELLKVLEMQEEILQFSHFTNGDAWELGNLIVLELSLIHIFLECASSILMVIMILYIKSIGICIVTILSRYCN